MFEVKLGDLLGSPFLTLSEVPCDWYIKGPGIKFKLFLVVQDWDVAWRGPFHQVLYEDYIFY